MASAAADDHARSKSAGAAITPSLAGRFRYRQRFCRWESGNSSNQPRVVLLSWVPVYTTVLVTWLCGR